MEEKEKLIIIDSDAILYRAYYALPPLINKNGEQTNAIYGFLLVFLKIIREFKPDFIVATFDFPGPTFRHQKFKEYKAKRAKTPPELRQQFPKVKGVLKEFGVSFFEKKGFEADDIIGSIIEEKKRNLPSAEAIIVSGDKDMLYLVEEKVKIYLLKRGVKEIILYGEEEVAEEYSGLKPSQLSDFRGLRGDPSDNIPGVPGIGEKTAISLLNKFKTIEKLYQKIEKGKCRKEDIKPSIKEKLISNKEKAFLSKSLAEIRKDILPNFDLEVCRWKGYNKEKVKNALEKYQFKTLLRRFS